MSLFEELGFQLPIIETLDDVETARRLYPDPVAQRYITKREMALVAAGGGKWKWDPVLHPRGKDGKFIEIGAWIKFLSGGKWKRSRVKSINPDTGAITTASGDVVENPSKNAYSLPKPKATLPLPVISKSEDKGWKKVGGQGGSNPGGMFELVKNEPITDPNLPGVPRVSADLVYGDNAHFWFVSNGVLVTVDTDGNYTDIVSGKTIAKETFDQLPSWGVTDTPELWKAVADAKASAPVAFEPGDVAYIKKSKSEDHARNEFLANELYALGGVPIPQVNVGDDGITVASKVVKGEHPAKPLTEATPEELAKLRSDFVFDAWLANWDVAGLVYDNVLIVDGTPYRIDAGGSLLYRAQGSPKGKFFGNKVGELDTLLDPSMNPQSAKVFSGLTQDEINDGLGRLASIDDEKIQLAVAHAGLPDSVAATLIARKAYILDKYGKAPQEDDLPDVVKLANIEHDNPPPVEGLDDVAVNADKTAQAEALLPYFTSSNDTHKELIGDQVIAFASVEDDGIASWSVEEALSGVELDSGTALDLPDAMYEAGIAALGHEPFDSLVQSAKHVAQLDAENADPYRQTPPIPDNPSITPDDLEQIIAEKAKIPDSEKLTVHTGLSSGTFWSNTITPWADNAPLIQVLYGDVAFYGADATAAKTLTPGSGATPDNEMFAAAAADVYNNGGDLVAFADADWASFMAKVAPTWDVAPSDFYVRRVVIDWLAAGGPADDWPTSLLGTNSTKDDSDQTAAWLADLKSKVLDGNGGTGQTQSSFPLSANDWPTFEYAVGGENETGRLVQYPNTTLEWIPDGEELPPETTVLYEGDPVLKDIWPAVSGKKLRAPDEAGTGPYVVTIPPSLTKSALASIVKDASAFTDQYKLDVTVTKSDNGAIKLTGTSYADVLSLSSLLNMAAKPMTETTAVDVAPPEPEPEDKLSDLAGFGQAPPADYDPGFPDLGTTKADDFFVHTTPERTSVKSIVNTGQAALLAFPSPDGPRLAQYVSHSLTSADVPSDLTFRVYGKTQADDYEVTVPIDQWSTFLVLAESSYNTKTNASIIDMWRSFLDTGVPPADGGPLAATYTTDDWISATIPTAQVPPASLEEGMLLADPNKSAYGYGKPLKGLWQITALSTDGYSVKVTIHDPTNKVPDEQFAVNPGTMVPVVNGATSAQVDAWMTAHTAKASDIADASDLASHPAIKPIGIIKNVTTAKALAADSSPWVMLYPAASDYYQVSDGIGIPFKLTSATTQGGSTYRAYGTTVDGKKVSVIVSASSTLATIEPPKIAIPAVTFKKDWTIVSDGKVVGHWSKHGFGSPTYKVTLDGEYVGTGSKLSMTSYKLSTIKDLTAHHLIMPPAAVPPTTEKPTKSALKAAVTSTPSAAGVLSDGSSASIGVKVVHTSKGVHGTISKLPDQGKYPGYVYVKTEDGKNKLFSSKSLAVDVDAEKASYTGPLTKDGHIPKPGMSVITGKAKLEGTIVKVDDKKAWVTVLLPDGTKKVTTLATTTVNGSAIDVPPGAGPAGAKVKLAEVAGTATPPPAAVVPKAVANKWLVAEGRKPMADGNVPYLGMPVKTKKGEELYVVKFAGATTTSKNSITLWDPELKKTVTRSVTTLSYNADSPFAQAPQAGSLALTSVYKYSSNYSSGDLMVEQSPVIDLPAGAQVWMKKTRGPHKIVTYRVLYPNGTLTTYSGSSANPQKIGDPQWTVHDIFTDDYQGSWTLVAVGNPDSDKALQGVYGSIYNQGKDAESFESHGFTLTPSVVDKAVLTDVGIATKVTTKAKPSQTGMPAGMTPPNLPPKVVPIGAKLAPPPHKKHVVPKDGSKTYDVPEATPVSDLAGKPAGTGSPSIGEAIMDTLASATSTEAGSAVTTTITDGDRLQDMAVRFQAVVGADGKEYIEARFKLTQDAADAVGTQLVSSTGKPTYGGWDKTNINIKVLKVGDIMSVRVGHQGGSGGAEVLKPNDAESAAPNVTVASDPVLLPEKSKTGKDVYRVQVVNSNGELGEVDIEDRDGNTFGIFSYNPDKLIPAKAGVLSVTPEAVEAGWQRIGNSGRMHTKAKPDKYGRKIYTDHFNATPVTNETKGGSALHRTLADGTDIQFNYAHPQEGAALSGPRGSSFNNEVLVRIPVDQVEATGGIDALSAALSAVGITEDHQKPPTNAELRAMAINKVRQLFQTGQWHPGEVSAASGYDGDPETDKILADAGKQIGLGRAMTMDDVVVHTDSDGRTIVGFSEEVAAAILKRKKIGAWITSFTYGSNEGPVDRATAIVGNPNSGLLTSDERYSRGLPQSGASSSADLSKGTGDRVYLTAVAHKSNVRQYVGKAVNSSGVIVFNPMYITAMTEIYPGTGSDGFGNHGAMNWASAGAQYENMFKRNIPTEAFAYVVMTNESARQALLANLKKRGVTEIGGRPVEEVVITQTTAETITTKDLIGIGVPYETIPVTQAGTL